MSDYTAEEQLAYRRTWTEALRSGRYEQGRGHLEMDGKFCCFGVAAKELVPETRRVVQGGGEYGGCLNVAPLKLVRMLGLTTFSINALMTMNDIEHRSFSEIADYIEQIPTSEL